MGEGLGTVAGKGGMLRSVEDGLEGFGGGGREGGKVNRGGRGREGEHVRVLERDPLGHGLGRAVVRLEVLCEGVKAAPVGSEQLGQGEVEQAGVRQACREGAGSKVRRREERVSERAEVSVERRQA